MPDTPAAAPSAPASTPAPTPAAAPAPSSAPPPSGGAPSASGQPLAAGDASKTPPPAKEQEFEVKIDGKVERWPLRKLLTNAEVGEAQRRRFDEIARRRAELDAREKAMEDPDRILELARQRLGDRWQKVTEEEVIRRHEQAQMTPEQQELAKLRQEKLEREKADAERAAKEAEAKAAEEGRQASAAYLAKWKGVLEEMKIPLGEKATPLTAITLSRFARLERQAAAGGFDAPPELLRDMVREEIRGEQALVLQGLEGDALLEHLGPEMVEKVIRAGAPRLLAKYAPKAEPPVPTAKPDVKRDRDEGGRFLGNQQPTRADRMFELVVGAK